MAYWADSKALHRSHGRVQGFDVCAGNGSGGFYLI